jgi:Chaperone of endosialidase
MRRSPIRLPLPMLLLVALLLGAGSAGAQVIVPNLIYTSVVPCRILDTRLSTAGRLVANVTRTFNIVGNTTGTYFTSQGGPSGGCSVPGFEVHSTGEVHSSGEAAPRGDQTPADTPFQTLVQGPPQVQAVVINLAVVTAGGPGFLNAWPTDHGAPPTSLINYTIGTTVANQVVLAVRQDTQGADISVVAAVSGAHLVGDIVGYFSAGSVIGNDVNTREGNLFLGPGAGNETSSTGSSNVALGAGALAALTAGGLNTAVGANALSHLTSGSFNVVVGTAGNVTTGNNNIEIGVDAGSNITTTNNNIIIGSPGRFGDDSVIRIGDDNSSTPSSAAFISGINGKTSASGTAVFVNADGLLGTLTSSLRFKQDVEDMGDASAGLMRLRPVAFHYKPQYDDGSRLLQYGLVAEEVAKVYPELVQTDRSGQPLAVRTHFINAMMLNEVQRQHRTIAAQQERIDQQQAQIEELQRQVRELLGRKPAATD